ALDALARALEGANGAILRATEMMRDAEAEAAALFRAVDNAMEASAGGGAGAGGTPADTQRVQQIATLTAMRDEQMRTIQELRTTLDGLGDQLTSGQDAHARLMPEAADRAERMTALIESMQGGTMP